MNVKPKRIGLFGGTFDPVHNGHISIAKSFLGSDIIDELWVLLNPAPPHKANEDFASFSIRLKMLNAAFRCVDNVIISDLEQQLPAPTYTIQTIAHLKEKYPNHIFYLCIGKDSFVHFQSWYKWQQILSHCSLLVADRSISDDAISSARLKANATYVEHTPIKVSSTEIRNNVAKGKGVDHLVPKSVSAIIRNEHLYTKM